MLLFRERNIDTVDCLLMGVTAVRGKLISILSLSVINAAVVISRAVVQVVDISHVDLRLLYPTLNIFALGAGLNSFPFLLIINNLT